jgi:hypothetical protein
MKTAVCFSGQCRALQYTYLNLKHYLIDNLGDCDVFIHACKDKYSDDNELFLDYLEPTILVLEEDKKIDDVGIKHQQRTHNVQEYLQMITSWKSSNDLRLQYEKEKNIKYDRVIRTRLDIKLFDPFPREINEYDLNYLYVPDFHSFACVQGKGRNDRFAFGNSKNITIYSNMIDNIRQYSKEGHIIHAESTLYYHLNKQNIKVKLCPIRFTRVRQYGEEIDIRIMRDPSLWDEIDKPYLGD